MAKVATEQPADWDARLALDPSAVMAAHARHKGHRTGIGESCIPLWEDRPPGVPPCLPYRLAERIAELEAAEGRIRALAESKSIHDAKTGELAAWLGMDVRELWAALDGPPDDQQDRKAPT